MEGAMSLVGKFFFHMGKEYHQSGEVIEQITPDIVLLRCDRDKSLGVPGYASIAVSINSMVTKFNKTGDPEVDWEFFDSRAAIDEFLSWLDNPHEDNKAHASKLSGPAIN